jgi:hypothetical protein
LSWHISCLARVCLPATRRLQSMLDFVSHPVDAGSLQW